MSQFASVLLLAALAIAFLVLFSGPPEVTGCEVDHTVDGTTVKVCDSVDEENAIGLYWYHNDTIFIEQRGNMDVVYVHELGHAMGKDHDEGTIMRTTAVPTPDCSLDQHERDIAQKYETVSISGGPCTYLDTPYGRVF